MREKCSEFSFLYLWIPMLHDDFFIQVKILMGASAGIAPAMQEAIQNFTGWVR